MIVTGWDNGLSQDYDKGLGRWFANRLGARQQLRKDFEMTQNLINLPIKTVNEIVEALDILVDFKPSGTEKITDLREMLIRRIISAGRAAIAGAEPTSGDCTPNHLCNGRMVHLPLREQCDKCGGSVQ